MKEHIGFREASERFGNGMAVEMEKKNGNKLQGGGEYSPPPCLQSFLRESYIGCDFCLCYLYVFPSYFSCKAK
jgi:hypothetical protein